MASNTERLGLLKMDPAEDANSTFNIKTMLNDNWDKLDAHNHDNAYSKLDHTHTPEDIGAPEKTHKHSADDITGGTLPVARGGTGNTSVDTAPTSGSTKMVTSGGVHTALAGKANTSHGNHVPATQTASNKKFLRNDNSWQDVTPANIGAVPTTRKVNGKALSADISLIASDVGAAVTVTYTATVTTSWTASGDYFYQDITVSGVLATDNPCVDILCGTDNAANKLYSDCICKVLHITTSANKIRLYATEAISTAFPIQLKVVR